MKSQPVEYLDPIEEDLLYAYEYYDSWHPGGRGYFREQLLETVARIESNAEIYPKKHRFFRRAMIRRTYFAAVYAIEPEVTTVVAVIDMRNDPKAIRQLLMSRRKKG